MPDRRVHARLGSLEIVRYDPSGKWYTERDGEREGILVGNAAAVASLPNAQVYLGLPGGRVFDSRVRRLRK